MKIVMWQNQLSHLQCAHIRALAERPGMDVTIVGLEPLTSDRTALGWTVPDFGRARVYNSPDENCVRQIIESSDPECIHMLAGWRGYRRGRELLDALRERSARTGLITEGADFRGWRGMVRRGIYTWERLRSRRPFDFILTMGTQGADWFSRCGYRAETIFPYAYIVERPVTAQCASADTARFELLFLGQLIARKGVDLLLRALSGLTDYSWILTAVGDGEERDSITALAKRLGLGDRTRFPGAMPYSEATAQLSCADLLVLPSRFDGWGAVVNEALMSGVPVVCSSTCGARDLVGDETRGAVFESGSISSLRETLRRRIARGKRTPDLTRTIRDWSGCIEGNSGARYMVQVLNHVYAGAARPAPIWSEASELSRHS